MYGAKTTLSNGSEGDDVVHTTNNLWVLIAALLVFTMTISVGFLEVGEMGEALHFSLLKTILITGLALVVMAVVGFNIAFAPTAAGRDRSAVLFRRVLSRWFLGRGDYRRRAGSGGRCAPASSTPV